MDYDTNSYPYSPRNPLASVSWKTPTTEDVLIRFKLKAPYAGLPRFLYVLYHWPRQRRPPRSVSLSPPPSHLARRDVTLKTPCKCAFCVWIQSICLLFSQLPYATWVVARDSCVVLLLVCSHCLKKLNPVGLVTSIRVQGHCICVLCICASSCPRRSLSSLLLGMFVYGMAIERLISSRTIARNFKACAKVARSIVLFD